jgi:alpha-ketoglutarate-dependent taurine dioxygenase
MAKTENATEVTVEQLQRKIKMLEKKLQSAERDLWFVRSERDVALEDLAEERKFKQLFGELVQLAMLKSSSID